MSKSSARRRIKIPTPESLANAALHYLSRYAASEASLLRVLNNRLRRAGMHNPDFAQDQARQEQLRQAIAAIAARHKNSGVLNDNAYAETKTHSLRRAGKSRRAIERNLQQKGVAKDVIHNAISAHAEEAGEDAEMQAAQKLAQRRKLGIFRPAGGDAGLERQRKDIAIMARAGFALDTIRKVLNRSIDDEAGDWG